MFNAPISNFKLENEKELAIYKAGFINGLDIKDNFKYTIMGYEVGEVLEIIGKHLMPTKHKMTRAEAIELLKKHFPCSGNENKTIDFYIEAGMLEIVEEEIKKDIGLETIFRKSVVCSIDHVISQLNKAGYKIVPK